jgi:hypothetical protein
MKEGNEGPEQQCSCCWTELLLLLFALLEPIAGETIERESVGCVFPACCVVYVLASDSSRAKIKHVLSNTS